MRTAEHNKKTPRTATGLFATRRGLLRVGGSGARSHPPVRLQGPVLAALTAALALALLVPVCSFGAVTRPFVRQITGTPTGPGGSVVPFSQNLGGVAVDAAGNLWVGDSTTLEGKNVEQLDEFNSSGVFVGPEPGPEPLRLKGGTGAPPLGPTPPETLSVDFSTGQFYVTGSLSEESGPPYIEVFDGTGKLVKQWEELGRGGLHVAVDNSPETETLDPSRCVLSECTVYVTFENEVKKFAVNASGEPHVAPFAFSAECEATKCGYIAGDRIVGAPKGGFHNTPNKGARAIAVDSHGNIYVIASRESNTGTVQEVDEYESSGRFVRAFTGSETPGVGESTAEGGWGGAPLGVTVDPFSEHLLVSLHGSKVEGGVVKGEGAVDEFDIATGKFLGQITTTMPGAHLKNPREMTVDSHGVLYVVNSTYGGNPEESEPVHVVDVYGPAGLEMPSVRIGEASKRTSASAVVSGSVNPEGQSLSACSFQYVTEAAFEENLAKSKEGFSSLGSGGSKACSPEAAKIPADFEYHPVEAEIAGLVSGITYRYRLVAATSAQAESGSFAFTVPAEPGIDSTTAGNLSSTFADLRAAINPRGADTVYHFEYLTEAAYLANGGSWVGQNSPISVPVAPADIGSGGAGGVAGTSVLQHIGGLQPSTVYRFRVVASNEIGIVEGEVGEGGVEIAHTFATYPQVSPGLPDNRAYELITPPDKGSAADMFGIAPQVEGSNFHFTEYFNIDVGYPSESGNQFLLETGAAFGPFPASGQNAYVFSRTPNGWAYYTSLASLSLGVQSVGVSVFDPSGFSRVGVLDEVGSANSTAGSSYTSLLGPPGGPYTTLHADQATHLSSGEEEAQIVGASHNLGHVVLESNNHALAAGAEAQVKGSHALYESTGGGECTLESSSCALVNVNSEGSLLSPCGAVLGLGASSLGVPFEPGSPLGNGGGKTSGKTHNAVSADGSRILFTAPDPFAINDGTGCWNGANTNAPELYMRSGGETIELSAPEAGAPEAGGHHLASYVGASADGSRVFFVTEAELTKGDAGIHDRELYEYDTEKPAGERLTRVSAGEPGSPAATAGAGVFAVPQVSADGSAVYFMANGVLASGASPGGCGGEGHTVEEGYEGVCNLYRYDTATGATAYVATVTASAWTLPTGAGEAAHGLGTDPREPWYTTPDGRYLLYADGFKLYRYQAPTAELPGGELLCVSCNPSGAAPVSQANFARSAPNQENHAGGPVVAMSDDGSYVFFDSADALVPEAANHTLDVYEWHNGRISLISPGNDPTPSYFLGASHDGSNVFFGTHAQLVPAVQDTAGNLYDARICTESDPCIKPAAGETAQCEGGSCQTPPVEPLDATPTSLAFSGPGNLPGGVPSPAPTPKKKTIKCSKGKKLSHGKCVKVKPNKKAKKAKKSNRRRGK